MKYRVKVTASIAQDEYAHNNLFFSKTFCLEGDSFKDVAQQIDFIYDWVEQMGPETE